MDPESPTLLNWVRVITTPVIYMELTNQLHGVFERLPQSVGQNRPSENYYKHIEISLPIKQAQPVIIFELHAG